VNGKIVRFEVVGYKPTSALGINCWAGEHLNFISDVELDVEAGDIIVARVTKEAQNVAFSSDRWEIPFEVIEIKRINLTEPESAKRDETTTKETQVLKDTQVLTPDSDIMFLSENVEDVVKQFKSAGFSNVKAKAIYDLDYKSTWDSVSLNDVETVSINGVTDFEKNQIFDKNAIVIISYHAFEKDNPDNEYNSYTVSELFDDLESNPMRAEDKHYKEYVEIKGKVCEIPSNGKHILICDVNDSFGYDFIYCGIETTELKDQVYNLSIGDTIIVKGKISGVNVIYDYQMDVYSIK